MIKDSRIDYIDGMKGLAALIVFFCHYSENTGHLYWSRDVLLNNPVTKILIDGCLAVFMFILLSGFSNALSMNRKPLDISLVRNTIVKRYLRLAVPIAPILIVVFLMRCFNVMYNDGFSEWYSHSYYNESTMNHLLPFRLIKAILASPFGDTTGVDLPTWMLRYILIGSYFVLMIHVVTYEMRTINKIIFSCFFMFICGYMLNPYYIPMIAGFILLLLHPSLQHSKYKILVSIGCLFGALAFYYIIPQIKFPMREVMTVILLFLCVLFNPFLQKILSAGFFKYLGRISFMIYLVHMPIIASLSCYLCMHLPIDNIKLLSLTIFILTTIVVILVAHCSTIWIEERMSKKVINKLLSKI
jgi:peptidoglycan/LPS O-acetylase OafA/YrhL